MSEGNQKQEIADLVENAVAQHVRRAARRELEAVPFDKQKCDGGQACRNSSRENGITRRRGLGVGSGRKPLGEDTRHAVENENTGVINDIGAAVPSLNGEKQRDQYQNKADHRSCGQLFIEEQNAREEGKHHAAKLRKEGIDGEVNLFKGLEAAIREYQAVDRPKRSQQQGEPCEFHAKSVDDEQNQKPCNIVSEEEDQKRLQSATVFLLKTLVEEKLHAEHQHCDHNDTVIHEINLIAEIG